MIPPRVYLPSPSAKGIRRRRRARGESSNRRISRIDALPVAADEIVLWAQGEAMAGRLTQGQILAGLNARLDALGLRRISPSAYNRWHARGLEEGFLPRGAQLAAVAAALTSVTCPHCGQPFTVTPEHTGAPHG